VQCEILSNIIKETKRSYSNGHIFNSKNQIKFTWNIVKLWMVVSLLMKIFMFWILIQIISNSCNDNFFLQLIELIVKHLIIPTPIEIIAFPRNICYKLVRTLSQILNITTDQIKKLKTLWNLQNPLTLMDMMIFLLKS
jgi:hypothetical protein